ncbi:MAG: ornithine carbamoyltransferase [Rhodospirillales bacterium]|nr:ornithine carbamoyltransferase [Rhodospirillales bacterium]
MTAPKHFLDIHDHELAVLRTIFDRALALKADLRSGEIDRSMVGKTLVMIFEKPSTRTRVSFQVGFQQMGGMTVVMGDQESQVGRGESWADTARVLSRYADAIMIRTDDPQKLRELAEYATVPVINGLTDASHPCQIMADVMTYEEHRGPIAGRTVSWVGDGNNVTTSWIHAAVKLGFILKIACPEILPPNAGVVAWAIENGADIRLEETAEAAVAGSDLVITDTWVSMGDENPELRRQVLLPYRVDPALMAKADPDALFMHCLPAHRGDEVTDEVLDGPQSVIWDEAENRLHAQKGILSWCLE